MSDSSDRARELKSWLMKQPRPEFVRVTSVNGETRDVEIGSKPRFIDIGATIDALEPAVVEAFKGDNVVRAKRFSDAPAKVTAAVEEDEEVSTPSALASDPETARLHHFADLLYRASRDSRDAMVALCNVLSEMASSERARADENRARFEEERAAMLEERERELEEARRVANEGGDPETILSTFANNFAAGAKAKSNGAKRKN